MCRARMHALTHTRRRCIRDADDRRTSRALPNQAAPLEAARSNACELHARREVSGFFPFSPYVARLVAGLRCFELGNREFRLIRDLVNLNRILVARFLITCAV